MSALVECIPNFSDGRRPEVIEQIVAAIRAHTAVRVLDVESDPAHNRTVVTAVGAPGAMVSAMFDAIRTAGELINLDEHRGEHPRIGATDVVPFVPLREIGMAECVALAPRAGGACGARAGDPGLPV